MAIMNICVIQDKCEAYLSNTQGKEQSKETYI